MNSLKSKLLGFFKKTKKEPNITISRELIENLLRHMNVHLIDDNILMGNKGYFASDHYLLVYSALKHFVFGSTLKTWNKANGVIAFLNETNKDYIFKDILSSLELLKFRVKNDQLIKSEIESIKITKYNLQNGILLIFKLPIPRIPPEAFFFAIYTNEPLLNYREDKNFQNEQDFVIRVFTLEYSEFESEPPKTIIGELFNASRKNLGNGPIPDEQLFLKALKNIISQ